MSRRRRRGERPVRGRIVPHRKNKCVPLEACMSMTKSRSWVSSTFSTGITAIYACRSTLVPSRQAQNASPPLISRLAQVEVSRNPSFLATSPNNRAKHSAVGRSLRPPSPAATFPHFRRPLPGRAIAGGTSGSCNGGVSNTGCTTRPIEDSAF